MEDLMQNGKLPSDVDMQFCRWNLCKQAWHHLDASGKRLCLTQCMWSESIPSATTAYEQWSQKCDKSGVRRRSSESTVDGLIQLTIPEMMQDKSIQDNSLFRDRLSGRSNVDTAVACGPTWGAF